MQIRPGGEKLSDTKVGEFDRRPLLFRLSAMQPMQQTLPPIITDSVIRTTAACWRWNRLPSSAEQNEKERENSTYSILEETLRFFFFFPVVVRKWTNGYQCSEGKSPISRPGFPGWYYFLRTRQEMKFLCALYHLGPPSSALPFFYQDILYWGRERKEPPLQLQTEKSSRAITCHTHQGWYTRQ